MTSTAPSDLLETAGPLCLDPCVTGGCKRPKGHDDGHAWCAMPTDPLAAPATEDERTALGRLGLTPEWMLLRVYRTGVRDGRHGA